MGAEQAVLHDTVDELVLVGQWTMQLLAIVDLPHDELVDDVVKVVDLVDRDCADSSGLDCLDGVSSSGTGEGIRLLSMTIVGQLVMPGKGGSGGGG